MRKNNLLKINTLTFFILLSSISLTTLGQIATGYEVATWSQFKTAAISYTFDDNTSNQMPVALPILDQHNFKATFFTVTNWGPDWNSLKGASNNGHEVASHTITHTDLNTLSISQQTTELQQSQSTIKSKVPGALCQTLAYPDCNVGDIPTIQKYYIAARICNNQVESSTPNDFYRIGSSIAGAAGVVKTANDFNSRVNTAKSKKGWSVFLIHGIDNDGGYSPLSSSILSTHFDYVSNNISDFWVATFSQAVRYIKERNSINLKEATITQDSLSLTASDNLDNSIYDFPVTVRRVLPTNWEDVTVYSGTKKITSSIITENGKSYVVFDVIPDTEKIYLANTAAVVIPQEPYKGYPAPIPGTIEVEEYDFGGQGVAFNESTTENQGKSTFRDDPVDIEDTQDTEGSYDIAFITKGEWLEYTVDVQATDSYQLDIRYAVDADNSAIQIDMDGNDVTGSIVFPNTNGWQNWETLTVSGKNLEAGKHIMRINMTTDYLNLNSIKFSSETVTSLNNTTLNNGIELYPNPSKNNSTLRVNGSFSYEIHSSNGLYIESGSAENSILVGDNLNPGHYIISVITKKGQRNISFIKM